MGVLGAVRGPAFNWSEEKVAELKRLVMVEKMSFSRIARVLGCGTRNMPLCKWNRLKALDPTLTHPNTHRARTDLKDRAPRPIVPESPKPPKSPKSPVISIPSEVTPALIDGAAVTVLNIKNNTCRFPIGDPLREDFCFCGNNVVSGSYCPTHHKICYVKAAPYTGRSKMKASFR